MRNTQSEHFSFAINKKSIWRQLTIGDTTLISSFKNLYFPTSLWNLLPQFFIQASSTCKEWFGWNIWFSSWGKNRLLSGIWWNIAYCQCLQSLPFLRGVDFVDEQRYSYLRAAGRKFQMRQKSLRQQAKRFAHILQTYPSSSLFIWSQKPMMYSQSSCLFVGWVALSDGDRYNWCAWGTSCGTTFIYESRLYARLVSNTTK